MSNEVVGGALFPYPEKDPEFGETAGQAGHTQLEQDTHEFALTLEDGRHWTARRWDRAAQRDGGDPHSGPSISIKSSVGKRHLARPYEDFMDLALNRFRFTFLPVLPTHTAALIGLPVPPHGTVRSFRSAGEASSPVVGVFVGGRGVEGDRRRGPCTGERATVAAGTVARGPARRQARVLTSGSGFRICFSEE